MSLLDETLDAHGGLTRWQELGRIRVKLSCGGIAMPMKLRPGVLRDLDATLDTNRPRVAFEQLGTFDGNAARPHGISRRLRWTDEDVTYFAGYALWNYMTTPFVFARADVGVEELPGRRLAVSFPPAIHTHCKRQVFHLDEQGRIARLDYTAEVFGPWARAEHRCLAYEEAGGILFATRRRVTPRGLAVPALVSIAIEGIEVE